MRPALLSLLLCAACTLPGARAQPAPVPPFSAMPSGAPQAPWRIAGLPGQKLPLTQFSIQPVEGQRVLQVAAEASYGNLVLDTVGARVTGETRLQWRWTLLRGLPAADLRTKAGDDVALKVCALFDMPLDGLPLGERTRMRVARSLSGEHLPAATLCYVWDRTLPVGTALPNAFSARVRYIVVSSGEAAPGAWPRIERPLAADFLRAFGAEASSVPPLLAIAVGADADNTGGRSLGLVGDIQLLP